MFIFDIDLKGERLKDVDWTKPTYTGENAIQNVNLLHKSVSVEITFSERWTSKFPF